MITPDIENDSVVKDYWLDLPLILSHYRQYSNCKTTKKNPQTRETISHSEIICHIFIKFP